MSPNSNIFENRYFSTYPVESEAKALWFSKRPIFAIISILWEAGPKGLTQKEVSDKLDEQKIRVGRSSIYQTLKALHEQEIVEREWDNDLKAHRNVLQSRWLPAFLDENFDTWIDENLADDMEKELFPVFQQFLQKVMERARKKTIPLKFIPKQSEEAWCHNCELSHEAQYFFLGLLYSAASSFVFSPEEWKFKDPSLKKNIQNLYISNKLASSKLGKEL